MKKIQFKYDGSEDAKKCIDLINKTAPIRSCGMKGYYYSSDGLCGFEKPFNNYTLLTPSEFLRLVTEDDWMPKVGDEVEFKYKDDPKWFNGTYVGLSGIGDGYCIKYIGDHYYQTKAIRPISTLKQKLVELMKENYYSQHVTIEQLADRIIEMVKGGEDR